MATGLWNTLEVLADVHPPAAVLAEWRRLAGSEHAALDSFLCPTQRLAQNYPCLGDRDCGCRHEIETTELFSLCQCEMGVCEPVKLSPSDIIIYELDVPRFGNMVGGALGFEPSDGARATAASPKISLAGIHAETRSPVFLSLCAIESELLTNLEGLAAFCGEPFIVLSPTGRMRSAAVGAFLQRERCAFVPLASCLALKGVGFRVTSSIQPILARFSAGCGTRSENRGLKLDDSPSRKKTSGQRGRLRFENDFLDIWLGEERYDLRERNKARLCIQYLFAKAAFDKTSACHFEKQIDPFVRKHSKLEPLPNCAETKLHHYFNPSTGKLAQLGRDLVQSAGRGSGRYFLNVE